jgi:hypothetical protein
MTMVDRTCRTLIKLSSETDMVVHTEEAFTWREKDTLLAVTFSLHATSAAIRGEGWETMFRRNETRKTALEVAKRGHACRGCPTSTRMVSVALLFQSDEATVDEEVLTWN